MLRPCKQCGCDFEASRARKVFCSPECSIIGTREARIANVVGSRKEAACINKKIRAVHRKVPDPLAENGHPPLPNTEVRICTFCNHPYSATFSLQKYGSIYCYRREENKRASEKRRENATPRERKFAVAKTGACACCGKNFIKRRSNTKFCSCACSHQGRLRSSAEISRTCSVCGSTFNRQAPFAKYCSLDCKHEAMKVRKPMKEKPKGSCKHCEREFVKKKSDTVFCCNQCRKDFDHARSQARKIVNCAICGSSFHRERGIAKFCSEECREARRGENQRSKYKTYLSRQKALKEEVEKAWVDVPDPKKENCHPPIKGDFLIKTCRYCKFPFTAIDTDRIYGHPNCRKSALRSGNRASEKVFTPKENKTTAYARKIRRNPF